MPIDNAWLIEGKVIYSRVFGDVNMTDLKAGDEVLNQLLKNRTETYVHCIVDCSDLTSVPRLGAGGRSGLTSLERLGWVALYGIENRALLFVGTMFAQLFRLRWRFYRSSDEALNFLQRLSDDLPDLRQVLTDYQAQHPTK